MSESLDWIIDYREGRIRPGQPWGAPSLDEYWRFKRNFTIILGLPNVGKTSFTLYMYFMKAVQNGSKLWVWSSENTVAELKIFLMEALMSRGLMDIDTEKIRSVDSIINNYVTFSSADNGCDATELIGSLPTEGYQTVLIDPYNGLKIDREKIGVGSHSYHYEVLTDLRNYQKKTGTGVVVCVHPVTEAQRRVHTGSGILDGLQMPPRLSDVEEGGKFLNRCDDFVTVHRYVNHPEITETYKTLVWVNKVKVRLTGGRPNPLNAPVEVMFDKMRRRFIFDGVDPLGDIIAASRKK